MVSFIKSIFHLLKIDIKRYPETDLRRRKKLFEHYKINTILDVGANQGQYALESFKLGFSGKIISFEPLKKVYGILEEKVAKNANWSSFNLGLGNTSEKLEINVSENTFSSSILNLKENLVESAPSSKYISKEVIEVKKLDDIFNNLIGDGDVVLLKLDVQGFEKKVLEGALKSLDRIKGIQIEMSIEELYEQEPLFNEMKDFIEGFGFVLHSLENGFYNEKTGKLLQVDGIFFRE